MSRHSRRCKSENESGIFPSRRGLSSDRVQNGNCGLFKPTRLIPPNSAWKSHDVKIGLHLAKGAKRMEKNGEVLTEKSDKQYS